MAQRLSSSYRDPQIRKQISIYLTNADWRALRDEAARRRIPMAELCRHWLRPGLNEIRHPSA